MRCSLSGELASVYEESSEMKAERKNVVVGDDFIPFLRHSRAPTSATRGCSEMGKLFICGHRARLSEGY